MRAILTIALIVAAPALATKRLAIAWGHNGGDTNRPALRYAEADAARMAKVFVETGRVEQRRVKLLQGRPIAELFAALDWARAEAKTEPTLLFVYLSSHATAAEGLRPGTEHLPWKELKRRITETQAKARVTIVDACQSSGLIDAAAKLVPGFSIEADDLLTVQGDAFITSSAAQEPSLEAGQLRGSVFTQHLIAGLRGAADLSQDGKIALDEAYRYAYERTTEGQSGQHPGWSLRLSGFGDIVMATLRDEGPGLQIPTAAERLIVRDPSTRDVIAAVVRPSAARLALPPGSWTIELEREGRRKEGKVEVAMRGYSVVDEGQLTSRAMPEGLVRLEAGACPPIEVPEPLPALLTLKKALQPALARVCAAQSVRSIALHRHNAEAVLRLETGSIPLELRRPWSEHQRLVGDLEAVRVE